jgi:hypothetical protein
MTKTRKPRRGEIIGQPTGWDDAAFICRKCQKKLGGGFGPDGKQSLRGHLRAALRARGARGRVGFIEVDCLGICPKGAVAAGFASAPGALLIVARGASAESVLGRRGAPQPEVSDRPA